MRNGGNFMWTDRPVYPYLVRLKQVQESLPLPSQVVVRTVEPIVPSWRPHVDLLNVADAKRLVEQVRGNHNHLSGSHIHLFLAIGAEPEAHLPGHHLGDLLHLVTVRSEERRVGKECGSRRAREHGRTKQTME